MRIQTGLLLVCAALLVLGFVWGLPAGVSAQGTVVPFDAALYGDLAAQWWKWALSSPLPSNPLLDTTGDRAHVGQTADVFFLAGTFFGSTTRSVTISSRDRLFFPVINVECSNVEPPPFFGSNDAELSECAATFINPDFDVLSASIDGVPVMDLTSFRAQSPAFDFRMPAHQNVLGADGVNSGRSVGDGYWLLLEPLSPGEHVIQFSGTFGAGPAEGFSQEVTYLLHVR
jgi:hypothetical protein